MLAEIAQDSAEAEEHLCNAVAFMLRDIRVPIAICLLYHYFFVATVYISRYTYLFAIQSKCRNSSGV